MLFNVPVSRASNNHAYAFVFASNFGSISDGVLAQSNIYIRDFAFPFSTVSRAFIIHTYAILILGILSRAFTIHTQLFVEYFMLTSPFAWVTSPVSSFLFLGQCYIYIYFVLLLWRTEQHFARAMVIFSVSFQF